MKDFLQEHFDMLKVTKKVANQNVPQAKDHYKHYANKHHPTVTFDIRDKVFLRIAKNSTSLKSGPVPNLSPQYCGPFKILKKVGLMA